MEIPNGMSSIQSLIDASMEAKAERPRPHLGCSVLGDPCDRKLWLSFRWAVAANFEGRILRVFRRGQNEEQYFVQDLRRIGVDIRDTEGSQARVHLAPHVSGSVDGVIYGGLPGYESVKHIAEFKTHSLKSFNELESKGLQKSKPVHYAQMQLYMFGLKIERGLYMAVCKDDDRLYTERVKLDKEYAQKLAERGRRIVFSDRMPEPLSADPTWYQCKFCDAYDFCHKTKMTKEVNCRTCAHSTPNENGEWVCENPKFDGANVIPLDWQHKGCDSHVIHPDLVPFHVEQSKDGVEAVFLIDGKCVRNGEKDSLVFSSHEILADPLACAHADEIVAELRDEFDGRIF